VLSQDAVGIKPGMVSRIVHWGGDTPLRAKVRRVEPAAFTKTSALGVDEQRVNVVLDLDAPPEGWRSLGDGFAVEIEITVWSKPDVIQVPTSAFFRDGTAWAVFVVESGRARTRHVEPGHRGPLQTEILRGLQPGETVIIQARQGSQRPRSRRSVGEDSSKTIASRSRLPLKFSREASSQALPREIAEALERAQVHRDARMTAASVYLEVV
jgi:hypothetical protein